jgi:hypothetical protein
MRRNICSKYWKKVCIAGLMIAGCATVRGEAGDNQAWMQVWVSGDITDTVGIKLTRENRYRDTDDDKYYYGYTDIALPVKLNKSWTLTPAVRLITTLRGGEWREDLMPHISLNNKTTLGPVTLKNRMRLVKMDKEATDADPVQYRHRLDLMPAKSWTDWKLTPYVAEEVFYDFDEYQVNKCRTYVGLTFAPVKKVSMDLYVMREDTKKNEEWSDVLVFGLASGFKF